VPLLIEPALPAGSLRELPQPRLEIDNRLLARPWHEDDVGAVRTAHACQDIQRWHGRRMDTDDEAHTWIAGWATRWQHETDASWAIVDSHDDRPIGQVGLRTMSLFEGVAQL
jgi:ribosomal-protein-alanine N-acetyltransferase